MYQTVSREIGTACKEKCNYYSVIHDNELALCHSGQFMIRYICNALDIFCKFS